jgi:hypothetical protein
MHNQEFLNYYFGNHWNPSSGARIFSGVEFIRQRISDNETVLDVGCGTNNFKNVLKHVVGIDPVFDQADVKCTIEEFKTDEKFDVALCLGSINFGTEEVIANQINKIVSLLKPSAKIFWRCNPGRKDHGNEFVNQINFFPWTFEKLNEFAILHGFVQTECNTESDNRTVRLYAEWHR